MRCEIYTGSMFARKTQAVVGRLEDAVVANEVVVVMRPNVDNREDRNIFTKIKANEILSDYDNIHMVVISSVKDFWMAIKVFKPDILAIDEVQFFDRALFI